MNANHIFSVQRSVHPGAWIHTPKLAFSWFWVLSISWVSLTPPAAGNKSRCAPSRKQSGDHNANKILLMVLLAIVLVSCVPLASATSTETLMPTATLASIPPTNSVVPTSTSEQPSSVFDLSIFSFPKSVDTTKHYLFYIHGRIIEEQGIPAVDPVFGEYEYQSILERLRSYGFVVISEQRVKNTDSIEYAKRIQEQVTTLLNAGVPATNITVVGASKGAYITIYVSHFLENREIKFVIMGICNSEIVADFKQNQIFLYGKVLSIYDFADYQYGGSCEEIFTLSEGNEGLSKHDEIVLNIGTGHGILYKPLDEWMTPVIQWARNP